MKLYDENLFDRTNNKNKKIEHKIPKYTLTRSLIVLHRRKHSLLFHAIEIQQQKNGPHFRFLSDELKPLYFDKVDFDKFGHAVHRFDSDKQTTV